MKLFYGDLRFVAAYKDTPKGTSFPAPLSLQRTKMQKAMLAML